ncbi:MAG: serine hydrolase [unclassified Hahellaceae]|nr:serine hydrolase [Hahellaceae bacterium]|tara:strand:- start:26631 stop:28046 length:1416 start_codon:yes stop_codon:yes gene_type:complete
MTRTRRALSSLIVVAILATALSFASRALLGFYPWHIGSVVSVASAFGAKVGCSGFFVTGLDKQQIMDDLANYSPVNRLLTLEIDTRLPAVSAELLGMGRTSASYRPGLGCTLNIGDTSHLDQLNVPSSPAIVGDQLPWPAGPVIDTILLPRQVQLDVILEQDNIEGFDTRALLLVENGVVTAESYAEGFSAETKLLGWSMAKSLSAVMIGRAEALGIISRSDAGLFPNWAEDERNEINVEHMLQMASGLELEEIYAPGGDTTRMLFGSHNAASVGLNKPLAHRPGEHSVYTSATTNMLVHWLQQQLGGTPQHSLNFLYNELLQPMAMGHTIFEMDPSGALVGSSFAYASARDWARLGQLMLDDGVINQGSPQERRLLPAGWVKAASTPNRSSNESRYGYHFWLNQGAATSDERRYPLLPSDAYYMSGSRQQFVLMVPSQNLVLVRLGWSKNKYPLDKRYRALVPQAQITES